MTRNRARLRTVHQQIRGSGSPTSMSTIRVPPKLVRSTTMPSGSAAISPTAAAAAPDGCGAHRRQRGVGLVGGDDRDDLALVGDVQRVDAEEVARAEHGRGDREARLVEHDGQVGVAGELVADRADATTGRVAQPARAGRGGEERLDEPVDRRGVGADVGLEGEVAAGQHHRHAVVADRARDEHPVARLHQLRRRAHALLGSRRCRPS